MASNKQKATAEANAKLEKEAHTKVEADKMQRHNSAEAPGSKSNSSSSVDTNPPLISTPDSKKATAPNTATA